MGAVSPRCPRFSPHSRSLSLDGTRWPQGPGWLPEGRAGAFQGRQAKGGHNPRPRRDPALTEGVVSPVSPKTPGRQWGRHGSHGEGLGRASLFGSGAAPRNKGSRSRRCSRGLFSSGAGRKLRAALGSSGHSAAARGPAPDGPRPRRAGGPASFPRAAARPGGWERRELPEPRLSGSPGDGVSGAQPVLGPGWHSGSDTSPLGSGSPGCMGVLQPCRRCQRGCPRGQTTPRGYPILQGSSCRAGACPHGIAGGSCACPLLGLARGQRWGPTAMAGGSCRSGAAWGGPGLSEVAERWWRVPGTSVTVAAPVLVAPCGYRAVIHLHLRWF